MMTISMMTISKGNRDRLVLTTRQIRTITRSIAPTMTIITTSHCDILACTDFVSTLTLRVSTAAALALAFEHLTD
jgi:hypothetical protein